MSRANVKRRYKNPFSRASQLFLKKFNFLRNLYSKLVKMCRSCPLLKANKTHLALLVFVHHSSQSQSMSNTFSAIRSQHGRPLIKKVCFGVYYL
jgi:hypothetical protein